MVTEKILSVHRRPTVVSASLVWECKLDALRNGNGKTRFVVGLRPSEPRFICGKEKVPSDSELADVTAHGRFMAEYDVAAWHPTDALMALGQGKSEDAPRPLCCQEE